MSDDFTYLGKYDVDMEPVEYEVPIPGEPVLLVRPAGAKNKPYHRALLKRNAKAARRFSRGLSVTPEILDEIREHDLQLYWKHVLVGWRGIKASDGSEPPFTQDSGRKFLAALPDWIFEDLRQFASNPSNFLADDEPSEDDIEDLAKN